ncbi:hypothetical protein C0Q70_18135 [Pomacea canaliculata]|uniref:Uncharacterized protein n=1 Tax=Pomacea canaliculata TaxID=400727 RepID=A0A2T7NMC8_POMCA|nr:hypothetical protein C0Q70_18135 [Pomacea canaliculata]
MLVVLVATHVIDAQILGNTDPTGGVPPAVPNQMPPMQNFAQMMLYRKMFDSWWPAMLLNQPGGGNNMFPLWAMWNMF